MRRGRRMLTALVLVAVAQVPGAAGGPTGPSPGEETNPVEESSPAEQTSPAGSRSSGGASEQEGRTTIPMPGEAREAVLAEMRQMLEALNGVLLATSRNDRAAMAEAARSGGTAIAVDTDPEVARALPEEFVRLGAGTHRDFDALAEAIEAGIERDSVVARLGSLTARCVACHGSYRVITPEGR